MTPVHGRAYLIEHLRARVNAPNRIPPPYETLADLLPGAARSSGAVVGRILTVDKGTGFKMAGDDSPGGVPTAFDDRAAMWKTVHISVRVDEAFDPVNRPGSVIRVGLAIDGRDDFDHMTAGLRALDRVALFLYEGSPVFSYDPSLWAIQEDGGFIATIDPAERLELPMLEPERAAALLEGVDTLAALRAHAAKVAVTR